MKCPRCGVPILSENIEDCEVCGYKIVAEKDFKEEEVAKEEEMPFSKEEELEGPFKKPEKTFETVESCSTFVGRKDDLSRLNEEMDRVLLNKKLSFVTVHGSVGIGKSRLIEEFGKRAVTEHDICLIKAMNGNTSQVPFLSFVEALSEYFEIDRRNYDLEKTTRILKEKLSDLIDESQLQETIRLMLQFFGYKLAEGEEMEAGNISKIELRMFIAIRRIISALAQQQNGLILMIDQVDRTDPESVNLLHYLAVGLMRYPVMIVTAGRDGVFQRFTQWANGEYTTLKLKLSPLEPDDAFKLFELLLPKVEKIPNSLTADINERITRNPRALEELARFAIESGIVDTSKDKWRIMLSKLATTEMPRTIEEILKARVRLLPNGDRDILNRASIFGEVFWQNAVIAQIRRALYSEDLKRDPDGPTLDAITHSGDYTINLVKNALSRLIAKGFISISGVSDLSGEKQYKFKYPPIWRLVYNNISTVEKKIFHFQAGEWLELHLHEATPALYEETGNHFEEAGNFDKACALYKEAAELASMQFHNDMAIRLYIKALSKQHSESTPERISLWHDLGNMYENKGKYSKALACYEKMLRLSWVNSSRSKGGVAFNKMGRLYRQKGKLSIALDYLKKGLQLFTEADDLRGIAGSKDDIGQVLHALGENKEAMQYSGEALEIRRSIGDNRSVAVVLLNIGNIEMDRGAFNEAGSCFIEALNTARTIGDQNIVCRALNSLGIFHFHKSNFEEAVEEWLKGLKIAENIGYGPMISKFMNNIGEAYFRMGRFSEANSKLRRAIEMAEDMHEKRVLFDAKRNLGLVLQKLGKPEEALSFAREALALAREQDILEYKARAAATIGEILSSKVFDSDAVDHMEEAKSYFQQGIDLFNMINNEMEVAKIKKALGSFLIELGEEKEAAKELNEARKIYARLGMKGLDEIKSLLDTLQNK
ncbi:MAG: tetratricopeptide repeat protein [Myxococcota bacterium]